MIETRCNDTNGSAHIIHYVRLNTDTFFYIGQDWQGYGRDWEQWASHNIEAVDGFACRNDNNYNESSDSQRDGSSRFWWSTLVYNGQGDTNQYYETQSNISYYAQTSYKQSGRKYKEGFFTSLSNYYVINYKPVYDVLDAAKSFYNTILKNNEWLYTEASYNQALVALYLLAKCNPNNYDYSSDVAGAVAQCGADIKEALTQYAAINLVKKTATVHIASGVGSTITVTHNGTAVNDGDTIEYGETLSASASALDAYDQSTPVLAITGGTVSGSSTLVNEPDITFTTADLPLNTYTLTFDPNGGTLSGPASVTATYTEPLPAATQATRDGYRFQRYYYQVGSDPVTIYKNDFTANPASYNYKSDITVTAEWTPINYAITFVRGDCSLDQSAVTNFGSTYTIEDIKTLPTATAPVGYHFDGWTVASANAGDPNGWGTDKIAQNASVEGMWGNVTLTATYAPNTDTAYTVEYYEMGTDGAYPAAATRTESGSGTTGETATADTTAPTGFTFDSDNVNNVLSAPIAADGSTVLKVYLSRNRYTVTVVLGEGTSLNVPDGTQYYYGETVMLSAAPAPGYGGDITLTVNEATVSNPYSFTITGNTTVATGDIHLQVHVTFLNADGNILFEDDIVYGSTAEYPYDDPTVDATDEQGHSYFFTGWDKPFEDITVNTVFSAQYEILHDFSVYEYNAVGHWKACSICGRPDESTSEVHSITVVPETAGTCQTEGSAHDECSVCGYISDTYSTGLNANNHTDVVEVPAAAGNCCTEGHEAGTVCRACGAVVIGCASTGFDTSEAGHSYGAYETNGNGTHERICTREGCTADKPNHSVTEVCTADPATVATCSTKQECVYCRGEVGEYAPANHNGAMSSFTAKAATCTEPGNIAYYYCSACQNYYSDENGTVPLDPQTVFTPATGHDLDYAHPVWTWNESTSPFTAAVSFECRNTPAHDPVSFDATVTVVSSTASCGEAGSVTYKATYTYTVDDQTFTIEDTKTITTSALPHLWKEVNWVWNADYSAVTLNLVCERCNSTHALPDDDNAVEIEEIPVYPADCESNRVSVFAASATYEGYSFSTATDEITVPNSALGHSYAFVNWDWSEDLASASANFRCTREGCTHTTLVTDPETEIVTVREEDCEYDRVIQYKAEVSLALTLNAEPTTFTDLSAEFTVENTKTAHNWGEVTYDWNEDHTAVTATRICANYPEQHIETETVSATYAVVTAAQCESEGLGRYTSAAFENPAFSVQTFEVTLSQLGHEFTVENTADAYLKSAATCTDPAVYYKSCERCGAPSNSDDYIFTSGDPLGHEFVWTETTHPTCIDPGEESGECSRCHATATRPVDPLGHDFDESIEANVTVEEATCTGTGLQTVKCSRCDVTQETVIPALGHDWGEWIVITPPDYGVSGQDKRICARCGEIEYRTTVLTSDADKFVKFTTVAKMKYILDVGNGFEFANTNTFYWYSAKSLTFRIGIANNADYDSVTVYLNGSVLSPNADGSYTIPAHVGNDTVTVVPVSAAPSGNPGSSSGVCPYCGQTHANNLWGRIIALFHTILAFFRNIFRR